ncbi:unnamed protein product, partial [Dovyalis caffra]
QITAESSSTEDLSKTTTAESSPTAAAVHSTKPSLIWTETIRRHLAHIPRLGAVPKNIHIAPSQTQSKSSSKDLVTFYYTQTLDHFNYKPESYTTFRQRYMINFKYWGGASTSAPIFVFFGAEEDMDDDLEYIGFLTDNASHFKALLVYIE